MTARKRSISSSKGRACCTTKIRLKRCASMTSRTSLQGVKHSIANHSDEPLRLLVMGFKIPSSISIGAPMPHPKVANLEDARKETVSGHPNSVLYKLLIGLHTGKRDLIDEAYVMDSFFWMDFAPGGTNWPHHHRPRKKST